MRYNTKSNTTRTLWCKCGRYVRGKLPSLTGEVLRGSPTRGLRPTTHSDKVCRDVYLNRKKSAEVIVPDLAGKDRTMIVF